MDNVIANTWVLETWQGKYWNVPSNWETSCRKRGDRISILLLNRTHLHMSLDIHHQQQVSLPETIFLLMMIMFMAKTILTRIPSGAGTVTIFPTRQMTMHFILQAVGHQADLTITCQTDLTLNVVCTIATIKEVTF